MMENNNIEINTLQRETVSLKRLYAEFNRETIAKMKAHNMEITEEPYNLDEVLRFLQDDSDRNEKQYEDRNAMKAQLFTEWLEEKNIQMSAKEFEQ